MNERTMVELRVTLEVNGRKIQARAQATPELWDDAAEYRDAMKANLLRKLGDAVVAELAPEVEVLMPGPTLHEALTEALEPYTYPYGKNGL